VALELKGVGAVYGQGPDYSRRALEDVSLSVAPGELVLVLGATGSGKSTLLRVASGIMEPSEGTVTIEGAPVSGPGRADPDRRTGLVFQDPERQLFADTVLEDVAFGPRNFFDPDPEGAAVAALAQVGLLAADLGGRNPFTLSGGEARRVAIAGVLAMKPRYLLMDEPTAGLDASGRAAVLEAVRTVRAETGVIVVTHDAEEFLGSADRVVVLCGGTVVRSSDAASLVADPSPFEWSGLAAPDVLAVQAAARRRGAALPAFTLDPDAAAAALAAAAGSPPAAATEAETAS
jgi:energy-coupling factor transport system ATP-binding protein